MFVSVVVIINIIIVNIIVNISIVGTVFCHYYHLTSITTSSNTMDFMNFQPTHKDIALSRNYFHLNCLCYFTSPVSPIKGEIEQIDNKVKYINTCVLPLNMVSIHM